MKLFTKNIPKHTKNIFCYYSPSPLRCIFTYFKAESPNLLSNDESISCIHKSWLGSKCRFSVCPPPVQLPPLSYRIATEEPGENQESVFNQKNNFLKSKMCKLISKSPQDILWWKRMTMVFYIFFKLLKIVRE